MQRRILIAGHSSLRNALKPLAAEEPNLQIDVVEDSAAALEALNDFDYSVFFMDLTQPRMDGLELIEEIQRAKLEVTVVAITEMDNIDSAVQATRLGAYDTLSKPVNEQNLRLVVQRIFRERGLKDEVASLRQQLRKGQSFHNIISKNPRMHAIFELISTVARTNTTVLIEGETGTGKEQVALAIHRASQHRTGPIVAVNCAALPESLLESELFGHEKGAFTSAAGKRSGRFEMAHGGTIFLDEVGDIPASMQAKLLRVLQERRFERVGGTESIEVDVRVIGATNRSLLRLVRKGKFREDLYYRLNVVKIDLPPLRDRLEDVPLLAAHFAEKFARPGDKAKLIPPEAMDVLMKHSWPGNVRELENAVERGCITAANGSIHAEDFPPDLFVAPPPRLQRGVDLRQPLPDLLNKVQCDLEKEYIRQALKKSRGNVSRCAQICGISRRSLSAKLAEYHINKSVFKELVNS